MGFDLWAWYKFSDMQKPYKSLYIKSLSNNNSFDWRFIADCSNGYYIIYLEEFRIDLLVHEIVHCVEHQLKERSLRSDNDSELLAYSVQCFTKMVLDYINKKWKRKTQRKLKEYTQSPK
jgi:hypothetical protein